MSVSSYILKKIDDDDVPLHDLKKTISVKFRNINSKRRHILSPQKHFSPKKREKAKCFQRHPLLLLLLLPIAKAGFKKKPQGAFSAFGERYY